MALVIARARRQPALAPFATHLSGHLCLPPDIAPWPELNHGRSAWLADLKPAASRLNHGLVTRRCHPPLAADAGLSACARGRFAIH
ncbi:hypothetical protein SAMN05519105_0209 [Rhodobacter sp. 24-YEA-8]|nr:hypothetical protein SAMN05519105_0209 [Rhodobacter sp. 24-YEA-8]